MRTIELTDRERRIHEEPNAHTAGNGSNFNNGEVEMASCQSR